MTVVINGRFLLNSFGGARRFAIELAEGLSRLRGDVVLVTPSLPDDVRVPDVPHESIGRLSGPAWEQIELPSWLHRRGVPLLVNPATIAPILYRRQITVLHDIAPALRPKDFATLFRAQWQLAVRFGMLRKGQRVVTISEASRREIAEQFRVDPARIDVVYPGADSFDRDDLVTAPLSSANTGFLVFGRHGAGKNIRTVIDAVGQMSEGSGSTVQMIGQLDPALRPYAQERKVPADRIQWRGPLSDEQLAEAYRSATAFIWPSLHEGFGLPPVEAQSLGLPVIASDVPVNREVLGDAALYFSATDAGALATAMTALAADPDARAALADLGRQNAARYTWERTVSGWNRLIELSGG
ncbi:glycosyltransferase family 4 protein [Microbacterium pygmaeum]|uniref:Glycosyltransferase involved in cell wall bisynthesis n=1 Tax=Microbacterium pygmaeum TaxID=370764 RepID=A0A1G8CRY2_9MICO|nr:glycosyltransferase family 1 protein [Microbacterium pygmaeum]SDH47929.1 Glycosyltransferase involved in cell wall bisynthesis [Microbacterium pygmaeum]